MEQELINRISKLRNKKVLVMLSGGKDSALCLALLKRYGANVGAIYFRHKWGWDLSTQEAKRISTILNTKLEIIDYTKDLKKRLKNFKDGRPCKVCKPGMYIRTLQYAKKNGFHYICIGDNVSDTVVDRIKNYQKGKKLLYFSRYLDCVNEGVKIPEGIEIFRPLIYLKPEEVEKILQNEFGIKIRRNHETGDKYFEYWREGCPLQYNEPGVKLTIKRMNELHEYNALATEFARRNGFRVSIQLPSKRIITIPRGHEKEIRDYLLKNGKEIQIKKEKKKRPFIEHYIIEVYGADPRLLRKCKDTLPLVDRFIERAKLKVVNRIHHDFKPFGNTIVFVLENSHLAIHAWPEYGFVHFDLLSCKKLSDSSKLKDIIFEIFKTHNFKIIRESY